MKKSVEREIAGRNLIIETGQMARQANGSVVVRYGDTMVLACSVMDTKIRQGLDFFPLTVDYREKHFAAGKIPGGFFKRESRPSEKETLTSRLIDRPMRPLFPDGFNKETQVMVTVLSADQNTDPDIPAMVAAFASLAVSDIPFEACLGAVRVGLVGSQYVVNPTYAELEESRLNLTIAGTKDAIMMVESGAKMISEEEMIKALEIGHSVIGEITDLICELRGLAGKPKANVDSPSRNDDLATRLEASVKHKLKDAILTQGKEARHEALAQLLDEVSADLLPEEEDPSYEDAVKELGGLFHDIEAQEMRRLILEEGVRADGRGTRDIRPISSEIGLVPRAHGSALFTRGETQSIGTTTLGTTSDELIIDTLLPEYRRNYYLHYNFPPFSTGEVKPIRGPGRREIGHGALAERAIAPVLPARDAFPYTIRIVSDILESNGSSSMATVCSGCLSLMDAGVPIQEPVAGIAMGLIKEGDRYAILSDILGMEDHLGDMDFKVTGTRNGLTALQMDIKISGLSRELMAEALEQARVGRLHILDKMAEAMPAPRAELKPHAPRIEMLQIDVEKIRDLIGPGGKTIRGIIAETGVKIDVDDTGQVIIASPDGTALRKAREMVDYLTSDVEVGRIYEGKVVRLMTFGAFVEVLPSREGLVHISQLAPYRVERVEDVVHVGDTIHVKVVEIDDQGRVNLSKKLADAELAGEDTTEQLAEIQKKGVRGSTGRGDRDGDRSHRGDRGGRGDRGDRGGRNRR
ncbi:polyribonucleotide nucleotidyltransferase [bacterium]|nr:polyribonucleotide nucleotidyltransferase [bacterium]NUP92884.1 polyribonucleotide nucleotidyltransferase [Candidatus Omnitrophota bacterium]